MTNYTSLILYHRLLSGAIGRNVKFFMEHLARMRTLDAAYEMLKAEDPDTAISKYYLRYLMLSGQIPVHRVGCKRLLNYDALLVFLQNPPEASHDSPSQYGVIRPLK